MKYLIIAVMALSVMSCTAIKVEPLPAGISHISIKYNPKVQVDGFIELVDKKLNERGISTTTYDPGSPAPSDYILSYTARRTWDIVTYLSLADIFIEKKGQDIAKAHYHLKGKGGLSMFKWQGVETKMTPVLDKFLENYPKN